MVIMIPTTDGGAGVRFGSLTKEVSPPLRWTTRTLMNVPRLKNVTMSH